MASDFSRDIDTQIQSLEDKTDEELLDVVGVYALSQQPNVLRESLAVDGMLDLNKIRNAGRQFLADMEPVVRDAICGPNGVAHYMEQPTVKDVVQVLLPALGLSSVGMVPTAIIAISLIIIRSGIREYCRGHTSQ